MFREYHYQVRGRAHERDGVPCQDRTAHLSRSGVQVLCLADGAGSAAKADVGAQHVAITGCNVLSDPGLGLVHMPDDELRSELLGVLLTRLRGAAQRLECDVKDLASTFLAVAVTHDRYLVVHVGDGVIGAEIDGELVILSGPDNGEFANQTVFVTSGNALASIRVVRGEISGVRGFILMSDGTAESLHNLRSNTLANASGKLMDILASAPSVATRNPKHKKQLKRIVDTVIRNRTDDDCALGLLARKPIPLSSQSTPVRPPALGCG